MKYVSNMQLLVSKQTDTNPLTHQTLLRHISERQDPCPPFNPAPIFPPSDTKHRDRKKNSHAVNEERIFLRPFYWTHKLSTIHFYSLSLSVTPSGERTSDLFYPP